VFDVWWDKASSAVSGDTKKGLNSLIILGAWTIWKLGATRSVSVALAHAKEEALLWSMAGAKDLSLHTVTAAAV